MNRRAFIAVGMAAAAGFVLDPERLLWRPGAKRIFLPTADDVRYYRAVADGHGLLCRGERLSREVYRAISGSAHTWMDAPSHSLIQTPFFRKPNPFCYIQNDGVFLPVPEGYSISHDADVRVHAISVVHNSFIIGS